MMTVTDLSGVWFIPAAGDRLYYDGPQVIDMVDALVDNVTDPYVAEDLRTEWAYLNDLYNEFVQICDLLSYAEDINGPEVSVQGVIADLHNLKAEAENEFWAAVESICDWALEFTTYRGGYASDLLWVGWRDGEFGMWLTERGEDKLGEL